MDKEFLRMQMLAGILTENQYQIMLDEKEQNPLLITMYNDENGFIELDSDIYLVIYSPPTKYRGIEDSGMYIYLFDKRGKSTLIPQDQKNKMSSYLDSFNIPYSFYSGTFYVTQPLSHNIEFIYGGSKPKFLSKPSKSKFKVLDFFIKKDNPKFPSNENSSKWLRGKDIYDFGGGEGPIDNPKAVIVDLFLTPEQKKNPSKFIEADLSKYIELPPKKTINITSAAAQINSPNNLSKTIKQALEPGGFLVIKDHINAVQSLLKYLKDFKLLEINYFDVEDPDDISPSDQVYVVLQK